MTRDALVIATIGLFAMFFMGFALGSVWTSRPSVVVKSATLTIPSNTGEPLGSGEVMHKLVFDKDGNPVRWADDK